MPHVNQPAVLCHQPIIIPRQNSAPGSTPRAIICPTFAATAGLQTGDMTKMDSLGGYGYSCRKYSTTTCFQGQISNGATKPAKVKNPTETVMFGDSQIQADNVTGPILCPFGYGMGHTNGTTGFRHQRRANVSWADGHVTSELFNDGDAANLYGCFGDPDENEKYFNYLYPDAIELVEIQGKQTWQRSRKPVWC